MADQRDGEGRYLETVNDSDLLFFFESGPRDFYGAGEVAEEFDLDRSQAHRRLSALAEEGELERVEVGSRNVIWWRPRDVVVLIPEETGFSIVDPKTGIASQGETRTEALRMLAEALELKEGDSEMGSEEIFAELDLDPDDVPEGATPPWE